MSTLTCTEVSKSFDEVPAVIAVDLEVRSGEIVGVIGPNGSGKSTLLSMMSGFYRPDTGVVLVDGAPVPRAQAHRFRRAGVARTFQNSRVLEDLSVRDNVLVGLHTGFVAGRWAEWNALAGIIGTRSARNEERSAREHCDAFLHKVGLAKIADRPAGDCSYGQRKRIELARAMIGEPRVLLLDEPMAGIPVDGITELVDTLIRPAQAAGVAVVLVEHRIELILELCDRVAVLSAGRKIAEGPPRAVIQNEEVRDAYLGE